MCLRGFFPEPEKLRITCICNILLQSSCQAYSLLPAYSWLGWTGTRGSLYPFHAILLRGGKRASDEVLGLGLSVPGQVWRQSVGRRVPTLMWESPTGLMPLGPKRQRQKEGWAWTLKRVCCHQAAPLEAQLYQQPSCSSDPFLGIANPKGPGSQTEPIHLVAGPLSDTVKWLFTDFSANLNLLPLVFCTLIKFKSSCLNQSPPCSSHKYSLCNLVLWGTFNFSSPILVTILNLSSEPLQ